MSDVTLADTYMNTNVIHNNAWIISDVPLKERAINQAKKQLYRIYKHRYSEDINPLPNEAIFEQALWLLRIDDMMRRAEQGIKIIMIDGIYVDIAQRDRSLSPEVILILGRKIGRSVSGRYNYGTYTIT